MSKLRAIGSDDKWHDVVLCVNCGTPITLEEDVNYCSKPGCDAEYSGHGRRINVETDQQKRDRIYVQSGLDNLWDPETEELYESMRRK